MPPRTTTPPKRRRNSCKTLPKHKTTNAPVPGEQRSPLWRIRPLPIAPCLTDRRQTLQQCNSTTKLCRTQEWITRPSGRPYPIAPATGHTKHQRRHVSRQPTARPYRSRPKTLPNAHKCNVPYAPLRMCMLTTGQCPIHPSPRRKTTTWCGQVNPIAQTIARTISRATSPIAQVPS